MYANTHTTTHSNVSQQPAKPSPFFQPKLTVNTPGDAYEQEADAVADQVMRMRTGDAPVVQRMPVTPVSVQRACAACESKQKEEERVQRKETGGGDAGGKAAPTVVSDVLSSGGGQVMDGGTRQFMESRFGQDFSSVRIHTDSRAAESASAIQARAYTSGNNIVFGRGEYRPDSEGGKRLLAHELVHVGQQGGGERAIQRRVVVDPTGFVPPANGAQGPPDRLVNAVQGLINQVCPNGQFTVNQGTGDVSLTDPTFCDPWHPPLDASVRRYNNSSTPVGCECLCNLVNETEVTTIRFNPGGPFVRPDSFQSATNGTGSNSTTNIDPNFQGQYLINGRWTDVPFFLLFSHELCGHALPVMRGTQAPIGNTPPGGTPSHEVYSVDVERRIAAEHGLPQRPNDYQGAARQRP